MVCYYYCILNDQEMVQDGFIHALNSHVAVDRFRDNVLPTLDDYTSVEFKETACMECASTVNVVGFIHSDKKFVLCKWCLAKSVEQNDLVNTKRHIA